MKKIWIIFLFVFELFIDVSAKEIIIDNISYDADSDFSGEGFLYDGDYKNLTLDGYKGGIIAYDDNLNIYVKNTNIIDGNGALVGINSKKLGIFGEGTLNIINTDIGINSEMVYLDKITTFIRSNEVGINIESMNGCLLSNSNVVIEKSNIGIFCLGSFNLNYTTLNIVDSEIGIKGNNLKLYLLSSNLYMVTNDNCILGVNLIDILTSQISLKSNDIAIPEQKLIKKENNMFYVSDDDISYVLDELYWNYAYFKMATTEKIDDLLISDEGLVFEIDKSFFIKDEDGGVKEDGALGVVTDSEYTKNEFNKIEVVNPETLDNIWVFLVIGGASLILIMLIKMLRRRYG